MEKTDKILAHADFYNISIAPKDTEMKSCIATIHFKNKQKPLEIKIFGKEIVCEPYVKILLKTIECHQSIYLHSEFEVSQEEQKDIQTNFVENKSINHVKFTLETIKSILLSIENEEDQSRSAFIQWLFSIFKNNANYFLLPKRKNRIPFTILLTDAIN